MKLRPRYLVIGLLSPGIHTKGELPSQQYDYGFQLYQEESDRIRVEAYYLRGQVEIASATNFRFQLLYDAISGASPTGVLPGGLQPFTSDMEDIRRGILGALSHQFGDHQIELEVSRSEESDYISTGIALSDEVELNQKNTTLAFGAYYLDDTVKVPVRGNRRKEGFDVFAGLTQILDKNTVVSANVTLGYSSGYLNDPYKVVQRNEILEPIPGFEIPVVSIYPENRPDSRFRQVLQLDAQHYFEPAAAIFDASLRLSHDDYGIFSQTLQLEWQQEIGDQFELIPFFRYYHQDAADFFVNTLNNVPIATPYQNPNGSGPNYSADYRLSSFDARSFGLRLRYQFLNNFTAMAAYERYVMRGVGDDQSPSEAYPSANIFTFGGRIDF